MTSVEPDSPISCATRWTESCLDVSSSLDGAIASSAVLLDAMDAGTTGLQLWWLPCPMLLGKHNVPVYPGERKPSPASSLPGTNAPKVRSRTPDSRRERDAIDFIAAQRWICHELLLRLVSDCISTGTRSPMELKKRMKRVICCQPAPHGPSLSFSHYSQRPGSKIDIDKV